MNDKQLKITEQYELNIQEVKKGRGCYLLFTDQGMFQLKEYQGYEKRCMAMHDIYEKLSQNHIITDCPITNKEGNYVSKNRDGERFLIKRSVPGKELDIKNRKDVIKGSGILALIHTHLTDMDTTLFQSCLPATQVFEKRMRELRKIQKYIRDKKKKTVFEIAFLNAFRELYRDCLEAGQLAEQYKLDQQYYNSAQKGEVCHGDYNYHHILKENEQYGVIHFDNCYMGPQIQDLYDYFRKMMEKQGWDEEFGFALLDSYMQKKNMEKQQFQLLYVLLRFPEKFWKISNFYYNSRKSWVSDRNFIKLENLLSQKKQKEQFLKVYYNRYLT